MEQRGPPLGSKNDELIKELEELFQLPVEELLKDDVAIEKYVRYLRAFRESTKLLENTYKKVAKKEVKMLTVEQLMSIKNDSPQEV
jgi:hypothetical protein